jgi:FxsC-like protein
MPLWFFMSYARAIDQQHEGELVRRFFIDLKAEVERRVTELSSPAAFFDQENLNLGDAWPQDISEALCNCRTMVAMMSARYFTSEYCGKEWEIFDRRRKSHSEPPPPAIIPILWVKPAEEGVFPDFATDLMMTFDPNTFLEEERVIVKEYVEYGLLRILKRINPQFNNIYSNIYSNMVEQIAARIINVGQRFVLQPIKSTSLPSLKDVNNPFSIAAPSLPFMSLQHPPSSVAASRANFVIISAKRDQMANLRENAQMYYGDAAELDWMPYAPNVTDSVALIAQAAATERRLIVNWIPVGLNLLNDLKQAEVDKSLTIVIIDPWTARNNRFSSVLEEFDHVIFLNCVVLIPWNLLDSGTKDERERLLQELRILLARNFETKNDVFFRHKIDDYIAFRGAITKALSDLEALLARHRLPLRRVDLSEYSMPPQLSA